MSEENTEPTEYVGFWARFIAFLIDSIAATLLIAPLAAQVLGETDLSTIDLSDEAQLSALLTHLTQRLSFDILLMGTIFILFWVFKNATPGKMVFRAVILDANTLQPPATWQHLVRYFGYFVSLLPLGLGFVWIGLDRRKQGWHDKLARTVVIRRPAVSEPNAS